VSSHDDPNVQRLLDAGHELLVSLRRLENQLARLRLRFFSTQVRFMRRRISVALDRFLCDTQRVTPFDGSDPLDDDQT
jgi:hypothetical protein